VLKCTVSHLCTTALDISADLSELGRTPVAVVCAGVKSILDIGRTLEVLVSVNGGGCILSQKCEQSIP